MTRPTRREPSCVWLLKGCPQCGGTAAAETQLKRPTGPAELDLDDPRGLAARLGLDELLALVELVPYKRFECRACGHGFRLTNDKAKEMAVAMLGALEPVAAPTQQRARTHAPPREPPPEWEPVSVDEA